MFHRESYSSTSVSCAVLPLLSRAERAEVFEREELGTRAMDEKRGKQKRRDRVFKTKTHNTAKTKHTKTGGDVLAQIKAKENIVAPNNGAQRITISRENMFTQKVGIYNRGKSSLMVSRRRPLHDVQPSQKTVRETERDLKRVLGYGSDGRSPRKQCSPRAVGTRSSPMATGGQQEEEPKQSSSEMEMSPEKQDSSEDGDSVLAIARRIAGGLHPRMVYSDSDYLGSTKSELRKLLKQRAGAQTDMDTLVASSLSRNPPANGVFLLPSAAAGATSYDSFFSLPLFDGQPSTQPDLPDPNFQMDMLHSSAFAPSSPAPEPVPPFTHLTEVELTTTSHPSYPPPPTDLPTAQFQMEPPPSPADEPRDFLDLLDTMQQGVIGENPPNFPRPPGSKWMPTPERPPMFPQKLY